MKLGFVGTGQMGNKFALRLLEAGHEMFVHDRRQEATTNLCELGAHWMDSPKAITAEANVVFSSLPNPTAVEEVALDPETGLIAGFRSGGALFDLSTAPPTLETRIAGAFQERGLYCLDAPVSNGGVFMTVGGDPDVFTQYEAVLNDISEHVYYMGVSGMGQVAKLARQYVSFATFMAEAEALLIAKQAGARMDLVREFMAKSLGGGSHLDRVWPSILQGDFETPATGTLDIVAKDVSLGVELARQVQAPAQIGIAVNDMLVRSQALGWGRRNWWTAVQVLEHQAHQEVRSSEPTP